MEFVVNEWLPEYFRPNATPEEKEKLEIFLNKFMVRNDKLFVRRPSEFLSKILLLSKHYQYDNKVHTNLKSFISNILQNSDRCVFVNDNEFELEGAIIDKLKEGGNTISDQYLFEAAARTATKTIITTDAKLKKWMGNEKTFKIELLDDFLTSYPV